MIEVFTARRILTMNPSWPVATAVAVRDGVILEVGDVEAMAIWGEVDTVSVRDDFAAQVIMPGFIDPHLHPLMAAVLLPMQFITAMPWSFPWEQVPATTDQECYRAELIRHHQQSPAGKPFFSWGYHAHWHGDMSRQLLDEIFGDRPAVIWQRSFHEVYLNTAMMQELGIIEHEIVGSHQIDAGRGHFYEMGLGYAISKLNPIIMSADWIDKGLQRLRQIAHYGGHTTLGDMAVGLFGVDREWDAAQRNLDVDDTPFRVVCVPHALRLDDGQNPAAGLAAAEALAARSTHRFFFNRKVKLFTDGAFFSQLAMLQPPGYVDGHVGEWLFVPEQYEAIARTYWNAGYEIHVHCTGDLGVELALDTLAKLQWERPRFDHGYTIEHFGFSTPEQVHRMKALGARVSANVYYLHELSEAYSRRGIGVERSSQMARVGSCEDQNVLWTLHSDFPMAPALPLHNAWVAASRQNAEGRVVGEHERVSLDAALRAITINAARILGVADRTGSIRAGKMADFAVLDADPYEVGIDGLRDIRVEATVFEGAVFPIGQ
jgi:predicted amidohydrolase YtcJ